jgi:hypothetical protein
VGNNIATMKRDIVDLKEKNEDLTLDIEMRDRDLYKVMNKPQTNLDLTNVAPFTDTPSRLPNSLCPAMSHSLWHTCLSVMK